MHEQYRHLPDRQHQHERLRPRFRSPLRLTADRGVVTPVETMFVVVVLLSSVAFLGFLGRLHAAGIEVANTSQSAARAASLEGDADAGRRAASDTVAASSLTQRCRTSPTAELTWEPSPAGTWQGGSVTVTVSCVVAHDDLAGFWAPGARTLRMSDTQPIDRYQR